MKRYISTPSFKHYNQKHAETSLQRRLVSNARRKQLRREFHGGPAGEYHRQKRGTKYRYVFVPAPRIFSFIQNTEEMIGFLEKLHSYLEQRKPVWVVMKKVEQLDYDGIVGLLSVMIQFKAGKIAFNGDYPKDLRAAEVLKSSGFFKALDLMQVGNDNFKLPGDQGMVTHARKQVDSELSARVLTKASKTIWGKPARCHGAQRSLLELMLNTNNHAAPGKQGEKHWWLSVSHDATAKKVSFAFVDYGVGVFRSLREKPVGNRFHNVLNRLSEKVVDRVRHGSDAELLRLIMCGELHRTASKKYYRGKGLPGIYDAMKRNQIANLHIITNNVRANVSAELYQMLPVNFEGTFIYFELNDQNTHCHDALEN